MKQEVCSIWLERFLHLRSSMAMLSTLKPVIRPPALTLEEVKRYLKKQFPELCVSPLCLFAGRDLDGCELFGQSESLRKGFAKQGLKLESFDCRHLVRKIL